MYNRKQIFEGAENESLFFWGAASQFEVDFVLGDHETAIEVKSSDMVNQRQLKGLKAFAEEYTVKNLIVVSNDAAPRKIDGIFILPWNLFLQRLWNGEII